MSAQEFKFSFLRNTLFISAYSVISYYIANKPTPNNLLQVSNIPEREKIASSVFQLWKDQESSASPSFQQALVTYFSKKYFLNLALQSISFLLLLSESILIYYLVLYLKDDNNETLEGVLLCSGLILNSLACIFLINNSTREVSIMVLDVRTLITDLISAKLLIVHSSVMSKDNMKAKFMNTVTGDLICFEGIVSIIRLHSGLIAVSACFIAVPFYFGVWGLVGLLISVVHTPIIYYTLQSTQTYRTEKSKVSDKRVKLIQNLIEGIKIIKLYAWELPYLQLIFNTRAAEEKQGNKILSIVSVVTVMCFAGLSLVLFVALTLYASLGNEMEPAKVFFLLSVYTFTQSYAVYVSIGGIKAIYSIKVACQRIQDILELKEFKNLDNEDVNTRICMENCALSWREVREESGSESVGFRHGETYQVSNISFEVSSPGLIVVIGPTGCGKTTLLMGLLGELVHKSDKMTISGRIGYAAEDPWIISETFKENIIMGREYNDYLYQEVLESCALQHDISLLPEGDNSLVGDRGITLSGGQKARLSLARTLYSNSDIYLLDDPLSAVDTEIGLHLFKTIKKLSSEKIVILATHLTHFISHADKVLVIDQGSQVFYGTPQDLQRLKEDGTDLEQWIFSCSAKKEICIDPSEELVKNKPMETESIDSCEVTYRTYWKYTNYGYASVTLISVIFILMALGQLSVYAVQYWCALWIDSDESDSYYITGMGILVVVSYIVYALRIFSFNFACSSSNEKLHNKALEGLTKTDSNYFDVNPAGVLITRFIKDSAYLDESIIRSYYDSVSGIMTVIITAAALIIIIPYNALVIPMWVLLFYYVLSYFNPVIIQIKNNDLVVKGSFLSIYSAMLSGYVTVRSHLLSPHFMKIIKERSLNCYRANYNHEICINFVVSYIITAISLLFSLNLIAITATKDIVDSTIAAFSLSLSTVCLKLTRGLGVSLVYLHSYMCSVQRLLYFSELKPEGEYILQPGFKVTKGSICFSSISMRYRPECNLALNNLSFNIQGGSKVGIVGRTGAGKSSILQVLFRLVNQESGSVFIDGVDHMTLGLHDLRKELSVIPQSPFLFSGSIRNNLDPFKKYSDKEILDTLDQVSLNLRIEDPTDLDTLVVGKDLNFSSGQKQLLCLARVILRKNQIVMMDEATSNIDNTTDQIIQEIVRESFRECTLLIIAHRLRTVIKTDQIIVMENGACKESGTPFSLFHTGESLFRNLVLTTGADESAFLVSQLQII